MSVFHTSILLSLSALAILAKPLQSTNGQILDLSTTLNTTELDLLYPFNDTSSTVFSASNNNKLDIQCDGARYGDHPSFPDCQSALSSITPDSEQLNFGERHTGLPEDTFPLPWIIMGSRPQDAIQELFRNSLKHSC